VMFSLSLSVPFDDAATPKLRFPLSARKYKWFIMQTFFGRFSVLLFPAEFHRSVHRSETLNIGKSRTSDSHIWGVRSFPSPHSSNDNQQESNDLRQSKILATVLQGKA